jgi:hypothetical protein
VGFAVYAGLHTVIPMRMSGLNQSVRRTTPFGDIELASHRFSEEVEVRIIFPRVRPINIWDYKSLERLGKIFHTNFNDDYREKCQSSSEHPEIFMLEVLKIQVAPIVVANHISAHLGTTSTNFPHGQQQRT